MSEPPDPFATPKETLRKVLFGTSIATGLMALVGVPFVIGDPIRFYSGRYPDGLMRIGGFLILAFSIPGVLFTVLVRRWSNDPISLLRAVSEISVLLNGFGAMYGFLTVALTYF